jgi:hypothetical protein
MLGAMPPAIPLIKPSTEIASGLWGLTQLYSFSLSSIISATVKLQWSISRSIPSDEQTDYYEAHELSRRECPRGTEAETHRGNFVQKDDGGGSHAIT